MFTSFSGKRTRLGCTLQRYECAFSDEFRANNHSSIVGLMALSLIEAAAALSSAIIGCHFVCFCCKKCCCIYDVTTTDHVRAFIMDNSEKKFSSSHVVRPCGSNNAQKIAQDESC